MAPNQLSPDIVRMLADQQRQINELRRKAAPSVLVPLHMPPYSLSGAIFVSESGRYYPPMTVRVVGVAASLVTAGTSTTTVTYYRNGVSFGTVDLTSGTHRNTATASKVFAAGTDYLTVGVTTLGTGSPADLVVQFQIVAV